MGTFPFQLRCRDTTATSTINDYFCFSDEWSCSSRRLPVAIINNMFLASIDFLLRRIISLLATRGGSGWPKGCCFSRRHMVTVFLDRVCFCFSRREVLFLARQVIKTFSLFLTTLFRLGARSLICSEPIYFFLNCLP